MPALTSQVIDARTARGDGAGDVADDVHLHRKGSTVTTSIAPRPVAAAPARSSTASFARRHRGAVLAVDGAGCAAIGLALVAGPTWVAGELGLTTSTPVRLAGAAFVLVAVVNLTAARSGRRAPTVAAIELDLAWALGSVVIVVADPWGASTLGRGLLVATALVSICFAAAKARGLPRRAGSAPAGSR